MIQFELRSVPKPTKKERPTKSAACKECGTTFERRVDHLKRRKGNNYCSSTCANKSNGRNSQGRILLSRRTGKEIKCQMCSKTFYVSAARLKQNPKFCSLKCRGKYQQTQPVAKGFIAKIDNRGEKNGRYKHGKRVGEHLTKPKVRKAVMERDGNWCLRCGKSGPGLHLHRVKYGSQGGKYEVTNCVLLCNVHHEEVHSDKKKWMSQLINHIAAAHSGRAGREWFERYRQEVLIP